MYHWIKYLEAVAKLRVRRFSETFWPICENRLNLSFATAYLLIFLSFLSLHAAEEKSEITVQLATQTPLIPIYIGEIAIESELPSGYAQKLEEILSFDFNRNGITKVIARSPERDAFYRSKETSALKNIGTLYVLKGRIFDKTLSLTLYALIDGTVKQFDGILSYSFAEDRSCLHRISDAIHKTLTGKEGIASTKILFSAGAGWSSDIWECDYDGGNLRQITHDKTYVISPVYFPSKAGFAPTRFLYVSYKNGQPKIFMASLKNGESKQLISLRGNQLLPAISPKRDHIAFISDADGRADLFIQTISPETGSLGKPMQLFTASRASQASPTFSPDGSKIAFVSDKDGKARIYLLSLHQKEMNSPIQPILLTKQNPENTCPAWSPDGTKLAYSAKTNGIRQIWIYDFATQQEWQLTEGGGNKENPSWAPNSLHLVFNSTDPNSSELYLVNLHQKEAIRITQGAGKKHYPSWEPRNHH